MDDYLTQKMFINPDSLLTKKEVLKMLTISDGTLLRLRNEGKFPKPILLSKKRLGWRYKDVTAWIKANIENREYYQTLIDKKPNPGLGKLGKKMYYGDK